MGQSETPQVGTDQAGGASQTGTRGALCVMFGSPSFSFLYALQSLSRFDRVGVDSISVPDEMVVVAK